MSIPADTPRRRWPWGVKLVLGLFALVLVALAVVYLLGRASTARWQRYAARLRTGGALLTFAEIEAHRAKIPDERNGALVIERLGKRLNDLPKGGTEHAAFVFGRNKADFFKGIPRDGIEPSRRFLERHRDLVDELAEQLRDKPTGRFDIAYDNPNPLNILLPEVSPVRAAAKLLHLRSILQLIDGELEEAAATTRLEFHVSATVNEHPTIIGRLVQIAVEALAVQSVENTLRAGTLRDPTLRELVSIVDDRLEADTMKWAFRGERAILIGLCDSLAAGRISASSMVPRPGFPFVPNVFIRSSQMRGVEMYTRFVDAADDPAAMMKVAKQVEKETVALPATDFILKVLLPSLTRLVELHERIIAKLHCARAGLSGERFRLAKGRWPASLDELVPAYLDAVPADPFDGKAMRFQVTEKGIVIYSIGEDLKDDGGLVAEQEGRPRFPDVGFRLVQPQHRGLSTVEVPPNKED